MQDFIGRPIVPHSWAAASGKGNGPAEYGSILYYVYDVVDGKAKVQRLDVCYTNSIPTAKARKSTISNGNKLIVVDPPQRVKDLFFHIVGNAASDEEHRFVRKWLHGQIQDLWS